MKVEEKSKWEQEQENLKQLIKEEFRLNDTAP